MNLLALFKAAILGIVEGVTEFIPVSSTGHLIVVQNLLHFTGSKENAFVIFIQLGAILAVVWLYRKKILSLILDWPHDAEARRIILNLLIATVPAVVIGLPTEEWIEAHFFKPFPVSLALIAGGVAILLLERWYRQPSVETLEQIPFGKALGVGIIQVLSILFPGVSRSGATIMGGLALGLSRKAATEFSFFLAIPAMLGASMIKMFDVRHVITLSDMPMFSVGFIVSFVAALIVIKRLLIFVSNHSFISFAWYRIIFGTGFLVLFWFLGRSY